MAKGSSIAKSLNVGAGIFIVLGAIVLVLWIARRAGVLQAVRGAGALVGVAPGGSSAANVGGGQFGPNTTPLPAPGARLETPLIVPPSLPMSAAPSQLTCKSTAPIPGFPTSTREVAFDPRFGLFNTDAINRAAMGQGWVPYNG